MSTENNHRSSKPFTDYLNSASEAKKCACGECNYKRGEKGEYINPCKMNHESGPQITSCIDHSESIYHPKT